MVMQFPFQWLVKQSVNGSYWIGGTSEVEFYKVECVGSFVLMYFCMLPDFGQFDLREHCPWSESDIDDSFSRSE